MNEVVLWLAEQPETATAEDAAESLDLMLGGLQAERGARQPIADN